MSSKIQRAVKARQSRYGETYSTALMHVTGRSPVGAEPPRKPVLGMWVPYLNPRLPAGTLTRYVDGIPLDANDARPLIVLPFGGWKVLLGPGRDGLIQGSFAAPRADIACLYADAYLHDEGFAGPGVGRLPPTYPRLLAREDAFVPVKWDKFAFEEGAKCACGHACVELRDRYSPCPACGAYGILRPEVLSRFAELAV